MSLLSIHGTLSRRRAKPAETEGEKDADFSEPDDIRGEFSDASDDKKLILALAQKYLPATRHQRAARSSGGSNTSGVFENEMSKTESL